MSRYNDVVLRVGEAAWSDPLWEEFRVGAGDLLSPQDWRHSGCEKR